MHLPETPRANDLARGFSINAIGRNECGNHDQAGIVHQARHLGNAANIFRAILRGKPQITVQPVAHIIAIQHITSTALINQLALQRKSKSRLAGGTQARQPECRWALIQQRLALLGGNMAAMPNDGSITFFAQNIPIS